MDRSRKSPTVMRRCAGSARPVECLETRFHLAATPVPLTGEFPLHTAVELDQSRPAVASDGSGRFVAVWDSQVGDSDGRGVFGRIFASTGEPVAAPFLVNVYTRSDQIRPAVAALPDGFVVVWASAVQDGDGAGIFGQRFDWNGTWLANEFQVNSSAAGSQGDPAIAVAPDGRFAVTWTDFALDGSGHGIGARFFRADGAPVGDSVVVNTNRAFAQNSPAIGAAADGSYVICWQDASDGVAVHARRFAADGTPQGDPIVISEDTTPDFRDPAIAVEPDGDFVVAWHTDGQGIPGAPTGDGSGAGIFARRFAADGIARGGQFPVNAHTAGNQMTPALAVAADGTLFAAWNSEGQDGEGLGVYGRTFEADGTASDEYPITTHTTGDQFNPALAMGPGGRVFHAWRSAGQDGSGDGVYGRLFAAEPADNPPVVSVSDAATQELDLNEASSIVFTLTLSEARTYPVSVRYSTQDATAVAPVDYSATAGIVTFAPGETSKTVSVLVVGDNLDEADETFSLLISDAIDATIATPVVTGRIDDNDPLPVMAIADTTVVENYEGPTTEAVFRVTLSVPSGREIRAAYRLGLGTADTATRGVDYDGTANFLTFAPGETDKTISVSVFGDLVYEGSETFSVLLGYVGAPTFVFADDGEAVGTISNDDPPPLLTAPVIQVTEEDNPAGRLVDITLTLSGPTAVPATVRFATADGTATAAADYEATEGVVTFNPGETSKTIQVRVFGDDVEESGEAFLIRFTDPQDVFVPDDGRVTIADDDVRRATVTGVFVNGTAWTSRFRQHLADVGLGSAGFGFLVVGGAEQFNELPWLNLDKVSIRFNREVTVQQLNLTVRGAGGVEYPSALIENDRDSFTYTWTFARAFPNDRLTLTLRGSPPDGVTDVRSGELLDGEWTNGVGAYPSGNGVAGGDFVFAFNVLPGDSNRDGRVDPTDLSEVRARQSRTVARPGEAPYAYSIFYDVNGSGSIDVLDYAQVRARQQNSLPPPLQPAAGRTLSASRTAPVRRQVFGIAPILA